VNFIRNRLAEIPGSATPYPYGGKQRQVSVNLDIPALQSKGLSPADVISAVQRAKPGPAIGRRKTWHH